MTVNIGFGNVVMINKIIAIVKYEAAPIKRMVQESRYNGKVVDATCGRKTKTVIVCGDYIILSALQTNTIAGKIERGLGHEDKETV